MSAAFVIAPHSAAAQRASRCGWHYLDERPAPSSIEKLLERSQDVPADVRDAVDALMRWYRSCDHAAARTAARSLQFDVERNNSQDPFLRALWGIALTRGPDVQVEHAEGFLLRPAHGSSNAERTGVRLLDDVTRRTGWTEVAVELAMVAMATRDPDTQRAASEALWSAAETDHDPAFWNALSELEVTRGEIALARKAAERTVVSGTARGLRVLGIAHMLVDAVPDTGAALYLKGLAESSDELDLQAYFDDLRLLLSPDVLTEWNRLRHTTERAGWIRRNWEWRAHLAGVTIGQRLVVNQRRLAHAIANYRRKSYRGAPPTTSVWSLAPLVWLQPLDDRGMIYLRHGEPHRVLVATPSHVGADISRVAWVYDGVVTGTTVFEFDKSPDRADYFLAEPHPVCGGQHVLMQAPEGMGRIPPPSGIPEMGDRMSWAAALMLHDPALAVYYVRCEQIPQFAVASFAYARSDARRDAALAWKSETAVNPFRTRIHATANLYAFRDRGDAGLISYVSIPVEHLRAREVSSGHSYSVDVRVSAGYSATEPIARIDTTITFVSRVQLPPDAVLNTAIPLAMTDGDSARITIAITNAHDRDTGALLTTVKDVFPASGSVELSDVVVAEQRDGAALTRGTHRLAPIPGHVISEGAPFRLYHELYGAKQGDGLSVGILIVPDRDDSIIGRLRSLISRREALSVEFEDAAAPDNDGVVRTAADIAGDLAPGAYRLILTVRHAPTGQVMTSETNLLVLERPT